MEELERLFAEVAEAEYKKPKPAIEDVMREAAENNQSRRSMYESIFGGKV